MAPQPPPDSPGTVSIYANRLQDLPPSVPDVFVTLNPFREPDRDKIITSRIFVVPAFGARSERAARQVDVMQGKRRTWFCGAYLREPFVHEQAYRSGFDCAQRLTEALADESLKFEAGAAASPGGFDDFLREIPLFAELDPGALAAVQLIARPFQIDAHATLFRQGDPPDGLYLIKHGEIEIFGRVPGDEVVKLATLGRRAIVGKMGVLDHYPRSAHAIAAVPSAGYFVSSELFRVLASDFRPAAFAVMDCFRREVAKRLRRVIGEIAALLGEATVDREAAARRPPALAPSTIDAAVLKSLPLFRTFRPADLREFVEPLRRNDFAPGQLVYASGELPRSCLLVVRGGGSVLALRFFDAVTASAVAAMRKGSTHLTRLIAEQQAGVVEQRVAVAVEST